MFLANIKIIVIVVSSLGLVSDIGLSVLGVGLGLGHCSFGLNFGLDGRKL